MKEWLELSKKVIIKLKKLIWLEPRFGCLVRVKYSLFVSI